MTKIKIVFIFLSDAHIGNAFKKRRLKGGHIRIIKEIPGYRITYQPKFLRHFSCFFETANLND